MRVELETALKRNITVLPVLLDGTSMPDPANLPEGIRDFAYRNAIEVEFGARLQCAYRAADPSHGANPRHQGQGAEERRTGGEECLAVAGSDGKAGAARGR